VVIVWEDFNGRASDDLQHQILGKDRVEKRENLT